jgi:hypothetical protein
MNAKRITTAGAVVGVSMLLGIVLVEATSRLVLNPANVLSVTTLPDPILGMRIAPHSAGFDEWGFRNPRVPERVDVVTVGDSHTFGNTARMEDAWPSVFGRQTRLSVYNLGVGGYGPNQYYHLMATRALLLHPKYVLCGLYLGDDFENAYSITYGLDYWASLRTGGFSKTNADIWGDDEPAGPFKQFRDWLSRSSMVYRLVVHGPVFGRVKQRLQMNAAARMPDSNVATLEIPAEKIQEAFRPIRIAAGLDQSRPEVKEGMRITFHFLKEMSRMCRENGCRFGVVIIPPKETVFSAYLTQNPQLRLKDVFDSLITNERIARAAVEKFLDESGIPYVDTLSALQHGVESEPLYYRGPADMHPNANGYRVIGQATAKWVRTSELMAASNH